MSPKLQVKLLRVLQENEFERVGESRTIRVDTRVIAATNQFLEDEIEAGRFRDDLYYRLNVVPIYLPPLRERREDIPALARFFLERHSEENRRDPPELTPAFIKMLLDHDWPGNVRELENYMERAVVLSDGRPLTPDLLAPPGRIDAAGGRSSTRRQQRSAKPDPAAGPHGHSDAAGRHAERAHRWRGRARIDRASAGHCDQVQVTAANASASTATRCTRRSATTSAKFSLAFSPLPRKARAKGASKNNFQG